MNQLRDIDKIYLYAKDIYEVKYQFLINKQRSTGFNHFNDSKASNDMDSQMIWMIFLKILKNTTQIKNVKY